MPARSSARRRSSATDDAALGPCPPFSPDGDILVPGPVAISAVPMGPGGVGLGWPGPPAPANIDAFSAGLMAVPPPPLPPGLFSFMISVDGFATGDGGGCAPFAPVPFAPNVGSEAAGITDAPADVYATCFGGPGCPGAPPTGFFAPYSMPNFQIFDGNGVPLPPYGPNPAFGLGAEPAFPGTGDDLDAFDAAPVGAWAMVGPPCTAVVPVYYSVDGPTAATVGIFPSDVVVTLGGAAGIYAPAAALGLDAFGPPGSDNLDALFIFDADGAPFGFTPGAGDLAFFSVAPGSAIIGTPNPPVCGPGLAGYPRGPGDVLTEGTPLGAPGVACVLVPSTNLGLWNTTAFGCGPNPFGVLDDNLDAFTIVPAVPPPTPTATATPPPTVTPTPTFTPAAAPTCGAGPIAGCRTPSIGQKALLMLKDNAVNTKDLLIWKWSNGSATSQGDIGDPLTTDSLELCVYDGSGFLTSASAPVGGICATKPCWKALGNPPGIKGYKYGDKDLTPNGLSKMLLKPGIAGKAKILVKGKGSNLTMPTLGAFTSPVTVQLQSSTGVCWEAVYSSPYLVNTTAKFKDKAD